MSETFERKNIAIYGSCISKDPFTTLFNKNYKTYYNCIINDQKHSFISTMQDKEYYNESDLFISPDNAPNRFVTKCIKEDLDKTFIDMMLSNEIDYLIFDINFEVQNGVVEYENNKYLTNITDFNKTEYYSNLKDLRVINVFNNPGQFFNLWKQYCDKFFVFLKTECPNTKVILAEVRALDVVQRENGSTYIEHNFTQRAKLSNIYYRRLEDYIKENYDVSVVGFDKDTVLKENHNWGKFFVHYDDDYYSNFLKKVNKIVEYDEMKRKIESLEKENYLLRQELIK